MIAPLILVTIVGCALAIVAELSVGLALDLPHLGRSRAFKFRSTGDCQGKETMLTARTLLLGSTLLAIPHLITVYFPLALGPFLEPIQTVILATFIGWLAGIMGGITHLPWARGFERELSKGDPDYDFAIQLAGKSGIRLKSVAIVKGPIRTRQPRYPKTICLSQNERVNLSDQDREVLIAERVGALRFIKSTPLAMLQAAVIAVTVCLLTIYLINAVGNPRSLNSVPFGTLVLVFAWAYRSQWDNGESPKLDRFTLQAIGDLATVELAMSNQATLLSRSANPSNANDRELLRLLAARKAGLQSAAEELKLSSRPP